LSNGQKNELDKSKSLVGETAFNEVRIGYSLFQDNRTMKAVLNLDLEGVNKELHFPPLLFENLGRLRGLSLIAGIGDTTQTWALHKILQRLSSDKSFTAAIFSRNPFPQLKEEKASFVYHSGTFASSEEKQVFLSGVQLVVFDGFMDDEKILEALSLAEQGYSVIYSMRAPSVLNALRRSISVMYKNFGSQGVSRIAEIMHLMVGQYAMSGLNSEKVLAFEMLPSRPEVRKYIEENNFNELDNVLTSSPENSGILTLNQSLLQNLIRRKIDLKTAFEVSRYPDLLDQLLKKVGV
jgi:twitching motility protein PilT